MSSVKSVARLYIFGVPARADKAYDYIVPDDLRDKVCAGVFTEVSFGRTKREAIVVDLTDKSETDESKLKSIDRIIPYRPLSSEEIGLCFFLKERTFCTFSQAAHTIRPGGFYLPEKKKLLFIKSKAELESYLLSPSAKKRKKRTELLLSIDTSGECEKKEAISLGFSQSVISAALKDGILAEREEYAEPDFSAMHHERKPLEKINLNHEQSEALETIKRLLAGKKGAGALLYGVTGSGKTSVIKEAADAAIEMGRGVIILIPEIALTPQTVGFFKRFYDERVCVLHSGLTPSRRRVETEKIARGEYDIVIGTRSAVFAPMKNIGLIVIDEEQEHTYKSEMTPRYKTHDIATFRCGEHGALLLLSSATPSVESAYRAKTGRYTEIRLSKRYGEARLPETIIADLRLDYGEGRVGKIGSVLEEKLRECIGRGEQAILFLNRRGFNTFVSCPSCGNVILCPHCSVSLTRHEKNGVSYLQCHFCGYTQKTPEKCPACSSPHLLGRGFGTQMIEHELTGLFGEGSVIRMDADTTRGEGGYERILEAFRRGDAPILLGTQMVTKGHDFPNVTLSGVIFADNSLYIQDYRANENTFSMMTQMTGRSGRSDKPGIAVIQTDNPEHPVIEMARAQDYDRFYENEIALRRALVFPPFCDILCATFSSVDPGAAFKSAEFFASELKKKNAGSDKISLQMFGPFEAPVYKVAEVYSNRIVIKFKQSRESRAFFRDLLFATEDAFGKKVNVTLDIAPENL